MNIAQQTDTLTVAYGGRGRLPALSAPTARQLAVSFARAFYENSAGSPPASDVGIVRLLSKSSLRVFTYTSGTTYTSISVPNGTATSLVSNGGAGRGFAVQAKRKFGMIGLNVTTADAQALTAKYWNGSSWATLNVIQALAPTATGEKLLIFLPPLDWVVGGDGILNSSMYSIRITAAVAPTSTIAADDLWVGAWIELYRSLAANQGVAVRFDDRLPLILDADEGIMPYFGTATVDNGMTLAYASL